MTAAADLPRERLLLDAGWRFQLGDPPDVLSNPAETNVANYPEIPNLNKLTTGEMTGSTSETNLARLRLDPVAGHLGENVPAVQTNFDDSGWQAINLPHDWVVSLPFDASGDLNHGSKALINGTNSANTVGWYRHTFTLPSSYAGKTLWLEFDGVYRNCLVWLNGHILGRHVSGYTGGSFDISAYARPGATNVLVVRVDASRFEGWFYEGAGIYRHVWLVKTDPVHVAEWGTCVTNSVNGSTATLAIQTQVNNDGASPATCNLASAILDPGSNQVGSATQSVTVGAKTNKTVTQMVTVANAQLWSLNSPAMYKLVSVVTQGTATNDIYQTPFGIRTFKWDAGQGLLLNGQRVELQGMCNHQDHAGVGIAVPDRVQYFRVETLKQMGCNTWRTSHNAPAPELLEACDQLGMLVLDEARRVGTDPETLGELQSHILRDRNHPSVFAWSLGNEEVYIQGTSTGASVMRTMQNLAHQLDGTRSCTVAQNGGWGSGFTTVIDVQGYNYRVWGDEDSVHASFPNLPSFATEEGSTEAARGIYADSSVYKRNYDNEPTHSYTIEQLWQFYLARPWNAGLCIWTGFDYRGEPTPFSWPNISSQYGPVDTCGFAKDIFYYYQANWTAKPVLHILPHWNWTTPGQVINVWIYANCELVELFLNGVSQGRQLNNALNHLEWNLPFAAGTLQAVGYIGGQPVLTNTVVTTGAAAGISLHPDRKTILADGRDVSVVTVSVVDAQGRTVPTATNTLSFNVRNGTILGLGNGDPICHESDQATNNVGLRSAFNGLAQVIVQTTNSDGFVELFASAAGLSTVSIMIPTAAQPTVPDAPAGPTAIASSGQVWLSWDVLPGATAYNVKRATVSGGPYSLMLSNTAGLAYVDTNVANGTAYYYVLSALNSNGEGANSVEMRAVPHMVAPLFAVQPNAFTNAHPIYAGVPVTFAALVYGTQPMGYQWYRIDGGTTTAIAGATNALYGYLSLNDTNGVVGFFLIASNGAGQVASAVAGLYDAPGPATLTKANTKTLGGSGDWSPNAVPDSTSVGRIDNTLSAANAASLSLGNDVALAGLQFIQSMNGPVNIASGNNLTLDCSGLGGWPGIDMSAASRDVAIYCALTLKGGQTWDVVPGRTLTIGGPLTTAQAGVDFGSFKGTLGVLGNVNAILGPWATYGSDTNLNYAAVNSGIVAAYGGGTAATANTMTGATVNYTLAGALTLSASATGNTLRYTGAGQTLALGTNTLTLNGLMNSGGGDLTLSGTAGSGILTIGANRELVVAANGRTTTLSCAITNNPIGASGLTYNGVGGGTLALNPNGSSTTSDNASLFTGDVVINSGTVSVQKQVNISGTTGVTSSALGDRTLAGRSVVVNGGATLSFDVGNELGRGAGPTFPQMTLVINKGGVARSTASNRTLGPLRLNGGTLSILNINTAQYQPFGLSADVVAGGASPSWISGVAGAGVNLTAGAGANAQRTFDVADVTGDEGVDLTIAAVLGNTAGNTGVAAGLIKAGAGTMVLSAANIYTGSTTINSGTLLVDGSLGSGNVTVSSGGVLGGSGVINGAVTVNGILRPGDGGKDTSTLTINNALTLAGNTIFALNRTNAQNASRLAGITVLTQGGTLTVSNAGGPLKSGDSFVLMHASSLAGAFSATNLPALALGLSWSNSIALDGAITVVGVEVAPRIVSASLTGGNLVVRGVNGAAGLGYRILSATNIGLPMAQWKPVATNVFALDGSYTNSIALSSAQAVEFFRVVIP